MSARSAGGFRRHSDRSAALGEAPLWSPADGCLWWIDIEGERLLASPLDGGPTREWPAPGPIGCLVLLGDGDLLAGVGTGLYRFERAAGRFTRLAGLPVDEALRFNDGAVDAHGRLWAGTMDRANRWPVGGIWRIGPDLAAERVFEGLRTPNGIAFDAGRDRLYFSDSHAAVRTVWCCEVDPGSGAVAERRVFARFAEDEGRPDGAAIDAQGNYWIAATDAGRLLCFAPDGRLRLRLAVPVTHPTKPAFGGPDLARLFLTSRRVAPDRSGRDGDSGYLLSAPAPLAGRPESLFRCAPARVSRG